MFTLSCFLRKLQQQNNLRQMYPQYPFHLPIHASTRLKKCSYMQCVRFCFVHISVGVFLCVYVSVRIIFCFCVSVCGFYFLDDALLWLQCLESKHKAILSQLWTGKARQTKCWVILHQFAGWQPGPFAFEGHPDSRQLEILTANLKLATQLLAKSAKNLSRWTLKKNLGGIHDICVLVQKRYKLWCIMNISLIGKLQKFIPIQFLLFLRDSRPVKRSV